MAQGIEKIPLRIPANWDAAWFERFVREVLANADVRNAIGQGLDVSGQSDSVATLAVSADIQDLVQQTFVLAQPSGFLEFERTLAGEDGVVNILDGGPNSNITVALQANGVNLGKLTRFSGYGLVGNPTNTLADMQKIAPDNDGQALAVIAGEIRWTDTPTWAGNHTWNDNAEVRLGTGGDLRLYHDGTDSYIRNDTGGLRIGRGGLTAVEIASSGTIVNIWPGVTGGSGVAVDASNGNTADFRMMQGGLNRIIFRKTGDSEGVANAGSNFAIVMRDDTGASLGNALVMTRATGATTWGFGATAHHAWPFDNQEIRLGAGTDLRLFHDGTDSWVRNDTGILKLSQGSNVALQFNTSRAFGVNGANYGASGEVLTSQGSGSPPVWAAATGGGGGGSLQFVGETVVAGAAATDITVSGLNLSADEEYIVECSFDNATASLVSVRLYYNGDTTGTNYDRNVATNGGSASATNDAAAGNLPASSTSVYRYIIRPDFDGRPRALLHGYAGNTTGVTDQVGSHMWRTASNVTSLTFNSSVASAFSIGSYVRVWKLKRTNPTSSTYGVYANSDQNKSNDTTLADDAALVATLSANKKYRLEFDVYWDSSATPDLKFDLNFTGTTTSVFWVVDNRSGPTANLATISTSATPQSFACTALNVVFAFNFSSNTTAWERIVVDIEVGATGGTFSLRWAQNTTSGTAITRRRNSSLLVTEIA